MSFTARSPRSSLPCRLDFERQFRLFGLTWNGMTQCPRAIHLRLFLTLEARFGESFCRLTIRTVLWSSVLLSHKWQAILLALILLVKGLCVAYKEFVQGSSSRTLQTTGGFYAVAAPGQVANAGSARGVSDMVTWQLPNLMCYHRPMVLTCYCSQILLRPFWTANARLCVIHLTQN